MSRSKSVPMNEFFAAVAAGLKAGKTAAEVAAGLGMKATSFSVRLSNLRAKLKSNGKTLPSFPRGGGASGPRVDVNALAEQFADSLVDVSE